ncbi:MAG: hypothetical protein QXS81_04155 [Candidatus Micrarchaeaceae archaeon]
MFAQDIMLGKQVTLLAQDSTDISAAKYGHRTPSKKEQIANKSVEKSFVFGYKLHAIAVEIAPADMHYKTLFHKLYDRVKALIALVLEQNSLLMQDTMQQTYTKSCTKQSLR